MELSDKLAKLPASPGVYLMKDAEREVIYVGKAKSLRSRVRSYFQNTDDGRAFTKHLVPKVCDIEFFVTSTEKEALILESNLIKQFRPRYNIVFRDDKTHVSIKVDLNKPWPILGITRQREKKAGVLLFGPYSSAGSARETLRHLNSVFPLRKCSRKAKGLPPRPCVQYEMGRCLGPCSGKVTEAEYREIVDQAILALKGQHEDLLADLRDQMERAAAALDFEKAAALRDRVRAIEATLEEQTITSPSFEDRDVFGVYAEGDDVEIQAMFIRSGKLEDLASYALSAKLAAPDEVFRAFLNQFYGPARFIPKAVLVPIDTEDAAPLAEWLTELRGSNVQVRRPLRGEKRRLVDLAQDNARRAYEARKSTAERQGALAESLQKSLDLAKPPRRVECFDVSNIHGQLAVGAMVVFEDGKPVKSRYRRFRIATVTQSDDFAMMYEILSRRYGKAASEDLPDMVLIDGGKGHLGVAERVFLELGITDVDVVGLAKARASRHTPERFFRPARAEPVVLEHGSPPLLHLIRIRDEAHRFAVTYHRKLRDKAFLPTPLDDIPGVGPARKIALLSHFGSVANIRKASVRELTAARNVSEKLATEIYRRLHPGHTPDADPAPRNESEPAGS